MKHKHTDAGESHRGVATNTWVRVAAFALLLCTGIGLRVANFANVTSRSPDERTYTWEAGVILRQGPAGIRMLVDEFRRDRDLFNYPSPARVGYLRLLANTMAITGVTDPRAGSYISCAASIASLLLLGFIGWRFFNLPITLVALLFYAVYPPELALARRAWQDALTELLGLSLVYVACEITRGSRSPAWFVVCGLLTGSCVTIKETAAIMSGFCVLWILLILGGRRDWKNLALFSTCTLVAAASAIYWVASSLGGLHTLVEFTVTTFEVMAVQPYNLVYQTGSADRLLLVFWAVSPTVLVFTLVGLVTALRRRSTDLLKDGGSQLALWVSLFCLAFLMVPVAFSMVSLRWLSVLFGPFCLLSGVGVCRVFTSARKLVPEFNGRAFMVLTSAVLVMAATLDYGTFRRMFVEEGLLDLSGKMILDSANHIQTSAAPAQGPPPPARGESLLGELDAAEKVAQDQPTPENYLSLSLHYHQAGRYQDCINAAKKALQLKPDYAEAYNNIAAAYQSMQQWDLAIEAAQQALRLKPELALARNNLAWSSAQKALAETNLRPGVPEQMRTVY